MWIRCENDGLFDRGSRFEIPSSFFDVKYNGKRIPGVGNAADLNLGANCQLYVYQLLRYFGISIPDFRSSELWADQEYTQVVTELEPFDIVMYHNNIQAYGAHVGLYIGSGEVLHLSLENGSPRVERHSDLVQQPKYRYFIGAKRLVK